MPASYGFGEILGVLVLAKSDLRFDAEDAAIGSRENRFDVTAVFAVVDLSQLLPDGTIFDFFGGAFQDDGFVGLFGADDNVWVAGDIFCFAGARARAEPEGVLPPDSPNEHEMRAAAGPGRGDPIIV